MPFIKYAARPESLGEGREARDAAVHPDTGAWIAEVDAALKDENVTDEKEHAATVEAARAYELANPPQAIEPPPAQPSPLERLNARIDAIVSLNHLVGHEQAPPIEGVR